MKILYFTGTGNSLYVAKGISDNLLSIPQLIKNDIYQIKDDVVGIIYPCYGFNVPEIVENYILKASITADYIFAIMTYGGWPVSGLHHMEKIFLKKKQVLDYVNEISMVNNYLLTYKVEDQLKLKPFAQIDAQINEIVSDIKASKKQSINKGVLSNFASTSFQVLEKALGGPQVIMLRNFSVNDQCTSCGICQKVCPVDNIRVTPKEKPAFEKKCVSCMACINNCPQNAIHHKREKSSVKYRNPNIQLSEIIKSNNQS